MAIPLHTTIHSDGTPPQGTDTDFLRQKAPKRSPVRRGEQFNIIHPGSGLKIDVFSDKDEELIVKKLQYYRLGESDKHLRDIRAMIEISGEEIDLDRVQEWVDRLDLADVWALVSDPTQ